MKPLWIAVLALSLAPVAAGAQVPPSGAVPPPDMPMAGAAAPTVQQRQQMQQLHAQLKAIRLQNRGRILAALSPQHRSYVAQIVGQLALSVDPNFSAAAQALDAALSPGEKQAVLVADTAARAEMRAHFEQVRTSMKASLSAEQQARMQQHETTMRTFMQNAPRPVEMSDPGAIVLRTLGSGGGPGMHPMMMMAH